MDLEKEMLEHYLKMDLDGDCIITKNEWMIACAKLLMNDIKKLQKEGPNSFMKHINELSEEFDKFDTNNSNTMEFKEFKKMVQSSIYIED